MERSNWRKRVALPVHVSNAFKMGQIWKVSIETKVDASMYTCSSRTSSSPLRTPILCSAHGLMPDFDIFKGLWKFAGKSKLSCFFNLSSSTSQFFVFFYQAQYLAFWQPSGFMTGSVHFHVSNSRSIFLLFSSNSRSGLTGCHSYIKPCISVLGRGLTEFKQIIWFQLRHLSWPISYAI